MELPARLPSPFSVGAPHPLAHRAAMTLQRQLREGAIPGVDLRSVERPGLGKMFGVLVVRDEAGDVGQLRAFSGMLDGRWEVEGFVPPLFDPQAKERFWPAFEAELEAFELQHSELKQRLQQGATPQLEEALAQLERTRAERSRASWLRLTDTYRLVNARGEMRTVTELFAPEPPPGGAGDCAGPKLLAHAYRHGLQPLAFAEFWWGAPSSIGDRVAGTFYPACQSKCGRVLPFMLEGLEVDPAPVAISPLQVEILFEDERLIVLNKPPGLQSKPGGRARDSLLTRLRAHAPSAALVYALEADQDGLCLAAKDAATLAQLQRSLGLGHARVHYDGASAVRLSFEDPHSGVPLEFQRP